MRPVYLLVPVPLTASDQFPLAVPLPGQQSGQRQGLGKRVLPQWRAGATGRWGMARGQPAQRGRERDELLRTALRPAPIPGRPRHATLTLRTRTASGCSS